MSAQPAYPALVHTTFSLRNPGISHRGGCLTLRPATEADHAAIVALVTSERLNPTGLNWRRFWVAVDGSEVVGSAQVRQHSDGSREIGSLVVERSYRHQGIASHLLDALLTQGQAEHYLIADTALVEFYGQWGFRRTKVTKAPASIRKGYWLGQIGGSIVSCIKGRTPHRLVVLHRASAREPARSVRAVRPQSHAANISALPAPVR